MSLTAVNQIRVIHGALNGSQNLKVYQRIASKMKLCVNVSSGLTIDVHVYCLADLHKISILIVFEKLMC